LILVDAPDLCPKRVDHIVHAGRFFAEVIAPAELHLHEEIAVAYLPEIGPNPVQGAGYPMREDDIVENEERNQTQHRRPDAIVKRDELLRRFTHRW
jgi:hypothetical protein